METWDAIRARRDVRVFDDLPVPLGWPTDPLGPIEHPARRPCQDVVRFVS